MSTTPGGGSRGGWGYADLQTENNMKDPGPQLSLSQGLRRGAGIAHRQQVHGGPEFRNYRRSEPLRTESGGFRFPSETNYDVIADTGDAVPPKQIGVPFKEQLDKHRRRMQQG